MNKILPIILVVLFSSNVFAGNKIDDSMDGMNMFCYEYKSKQGYVFPGGSYGGEIRKSSLGLIFGKIPNIEIIKASWDQEQLEFSDKYSYYAKPDYIVINKRHKISMFEKLLVDIDMMDRCAKGCKTYFIDRMSGKVYEEMTRYKTSSGWPKTKSELLKGYKSGSAAHTWNCKTIQTKNNLIKVLQKHHSKLHKDYIHEKELKKTYKEQEKLDRERKAIEEDNLIRENRKF